jgi:hypothetical protein
MTFSHFDICIGVGALLSTSPSRRPPVLGVLVRPSILPRTFHYCKTSIFQKLSSMGPGFQIVTMFRVMVEYKILPKMGIMRSPWLMRD